MKMLVSFLVLCAGLSAHALDESQAVDNSSTVSVSLQQLWMENGDNALVHLVGTGGEAQLRAWVTCTPAMVSRTARNGFIRTPLGVYRNPSYAVHVEEGRMYCSEIVR